MVKGRWPHAEGESGGHRLGAVGSHVPQLGLLSGAARRRSVFWRIYFWNYAALTLAGLIWEVTHPREAQLSQLVGLVFLPIALLALAGRAFSATILTPGTWRALLLFSLGWETFALATGVSPSSAMVADLTPSPPGPSAAGMEDVAEFIRIMTKFVIPTTIWLSALPPLVALYQNAYPRTRRQAVEG